MRGPIVRAATAGALSLLVLLSGAAVLADLAEWPLRGTVALRGATPVDPPPDERRDSHASFLIEGEAARRLWDALRVPEEEDPCPSDGADGGRVKRSGFFVCTRSAKADRYECDFAVDLERGMLALGRVC